MVFSINFCNTFFRSRDIQVFVKKLMMSQTLQMTVTNHKIEKYLHRHFLNSHKHACMRYYCLLF